MKKKRKVQVKLSLKPSHHSLLQCIQQASFYWPF